MKKYGAVVLSNLESPLLLETLIELRKKKKKPYNICLLMFYINWQIHGLRNVEQRSRLPYITKTIGHGLKVYPISHHGSYIVTTYSTKIFLGYTGCHSDSLTKDWIRSLTAGIVTHRKDETYWKGKQDIMKWQNLLEGTIMLGKKWRHQKKGISSRKWIDSVNEAIAFSLQNLNKSSQR